MRRTLVVLVLGAACGSSAPSSPGIDAAPGQHPDAGSSPAGWLQVSGNQILLDGKPFHGRGVDFWDERQCEACSYAPPDPAGEDRWADELVNDWHVSLVRFLVTGKSAPYNQYEMQWQSIGADSSYFADVKENVTHLTDAGVHVLVTLFTDDTMIPETGDYNSEWPGSAGDTNSRYTLLAQAFATNPLVLFGLTNEPHGDGSHDAELAAAYESAIAAIRAVEDGGGTPHHVIAVQAPEGYARDLTYFVAHPLPDDDIVYEVHPYNAATDFDALLTGPHQTLPILIGEYGPAGAMTAQDIQDLWTLAQAEDIPHIGWVFHWNCGPNLLSEATADAPSDGCGLDASTGYTWPRQPWGDMMYAYLNTPW